MASAMIVAVVVPSPAVSDVLLATSFTIRAPMSSNLSDSSISRATVTPSLVTVGEPKLFCRITFRPRGPRVTRTAFASLLTPERILSCASWSKAIILAMGETLLNLMRSESVRHKVGGRRRGRNRRLVRDRSVDREHVAFAEQQVVLFAD